VEKAVAATHGQWQPAGSTVAATFSTHNASHSGSAARNLDIFKNQPSNLQSLIISLFRYFCPLY